MQCRDCEPYLNALADGELSPLVAWRMKQHLKRCPSCAQSYAEILRIGEAAHAWRDATATPVSEPLRSRITGTVADDNPTLAAASGRTTRRKERFMISPIPALAVTVSLCTAVLVGIGVQVAPPKIGTPGIAFAQVESAVAQARTAHIIFRIQPDTVSNAETTVTAYEAWLCADPPAYALVTQATRMVGDANGTLLYIEGQKPMPINSTPVTREAIQKEMLFPGLDVMKDSLPIPHQWGDSTTVKDDKGRAVLQFISEENGIRRVLWADPETRLPVRVEVQMKTIPVPNDSTVAPVSTRFWVEFSYNETPPKGIFDHQATPSKKH